MSFIFYLLIGWLAGWLVLWLVGWLVGWFVSHATTNLTLKINFVSCNYIKTQMPLFLDIGYV